MPYGLLAQRELVAPFARSVATPRGCFLVQSEASRHKPEVPEFPAWLVAEACVSA